MQDGWEVSYGTNPLVEDECEDLNGDGITNIDEYAASATDFTIAGCMNSVDTETSAGEESES